MRIGSPQESFGEGVGTEGKARPLHDTQARAGEAKHRKRHPVEVAGKGGFIRIKNTTWR